MADVSTAASPVKKVAKAAAVKKPKVPAAHPPFADMIVAALKALKDRTGSSRQAILKYICANYKVTADKAGVHLKMALKRGVTGGLLKMARASGKGAGSYKLGDKAKEVKKPKVKKPAAKKPAAKKTTVKKKPAVKKASTKKPTDKKKATTKKTSAANKPAATKKPVAKKPAAKKTTDKKKQTVKKAAAKKPAAKKPAAKKPVAKK